MDQKQLETALRNLDPTACVAAVGGARLTDLDDARQFIDAIRHSGSMVIEWPDAGREAQRDVLVAKCRELLALPAVAQHLAEFDQHVTAARLIERGFRAVELTLSKHPVSARTPAEQLWGLLRWVESGMEHLDERVKAAMAAPGSFNDITRLQIPTEGGESVPANAVVTGAVSNAGNTLLMLGHRHGLLDAESGLLRLPPEPPLDRKAIEEAAALIFLSSAWAQLRRGWERVRFFDGEVRRGDHDVPLKEGGTRRVQVLDFSKPDRVELLDHVASDRLGQRLLTNQIDFQTQTDIASKIRPPSSGVVPLPPEGWISLEEFNASHSLSQHYCLPIDDDAQMAQGLSLKAWLRGYAIYARWLARDPQDQPALRIISYTEAELAAQLTKGGLAPEQAALFIELTTFGRRSKDLFDTPLIRSGDGRLLFFAPAYLSPNPGAVLVSRLGRLGVRFDNKGKRFERQTLQVFADAKVPARSFKYTLDGKKWDCDVAALWEDTLFVFECKNYGLPDGHLPSLQHFVLQLSGHIGQARRISQQLDENPAIVRQHFGPEATWKRVVPCVLHALPWSAGKLGEVYCYDASALGRFFEKGFISIKMTLSIGPNRFITRRHKFPLWQSEKPTPQDLLRELNEPAQLRLPMAEREITARLTPLSPDMAVVVPEWTPRELTLEEKFRVGGADEDEAKRLVEEFERFPAAVAEARERHAASQARSAT